MRVAVISDIHANLHALEAVLAEIEREGADEVWCLGDVVGYGPQPNECCALVRERASLCLCGNHDLAVLGGLDIADFSGDAGVAARWTQRGARARARATGCARCARARRAAHAELFHASPRDAGLGLRAQRRGRAASLRMTTAPVVLVGHSHVALALWLADGAAGRRPGPRRDRASTLAGRRSLLNPGSVGQPRDGDARAAWLALDLDGDGPFRRIDYDIDGAQADARARGCRRRSPRG